MKPLALGVIADLRRQRLLPIAIGLVVALVALPVLLRKAPEPQASARPIPVVETSPDGLPAPETALETAPLVTMASLKGASDLDSFDSNDPFKPLQTLDQVATGPALDAGAANIAIAGSGLGGAGGTDSTGGSAGTGTGDTSPGSGEGSDPSPAPAPAPEPRTDPDPKPQSDPDPKSLSYVIDVTFTGPDGKRVVRGLPRLSMLPTETAPLVVFLGVSDNAYEAVFLVDAKLSAASGEGDCVPDPEQCATVELGPGEIQTFFDAEGRRYVLALDQVRQVPVQRAAQARERRSERAGVSSQPLSPFLPPLVDLVTIRGER